MKENTTKNILYVGGFELPDKNAAAQRVVANARILNELGYSVVFIGVDKSCNFIEHEIKELKIDDFKFYTKPQKYPKSKIQWLNFITNFSFVRQTIENDLDKNIDIIIAYNYPAITLKKLINYGRKNNFKVLADITEWYEPQGNFLFRFIKRFDSYLRMDFFHKKVDGIIAISKYLSDFYKKSGCNTIIIPPLVNFNSLNYPKVVFSNNDIINLTYVGQPFPVDGRSVSESSFKDRPDKIIDVLFELKNHEFAFYIYGLTRKQYLSVVKRHDFVIKELGNKIKFHGYIDNIEAKMKISEADFTILFRDINRMTSAGFPTKVVESISCGTPVITNNTSDLKEYIVQGKNGFLVNTEIENNLLEKMVEIISLQRKDINAMKEYCKVSQLFSHTNYVDEMKQFLSSL